MSQTLTPPAPPANETAENRLKRLHMRSIRRGIKEMDIILMTFSEMRLKGLDAAQLDLYEALLEENDHDLYQWISGQAPTPAHYLDLVLDVAACIPSGNSGAPNT